MPLSPFRATADPQLGGARLERVFFMQKDRLNLAELKAKTPADLLKKAKEEYKGVSDALEMETRARLANKKRTNQLANETSYRKNQIDKVKGVLPDIINDMVEGLQELAQARGAQPAIEKEQAGAGGPLEVSLPEALKESQAQTKAVEEKLKNFCRQVFELFGS
jgi:hypothetical protein